MAKLQKISDDAYDIIDKGDENFHHVILKETSPYKDVEYQYGAVKLLEEDDQLRVKFEYEIFDNPWFLDTASPKFVEYIGHILMTNLEELLVYSKHQKESKSGA